MRIAIRGFAFSLLLLLAVWGAQSLQTKQLLFDVCDLRDSDSDLSLIDGECINQGPCKYCIKVLDHNSVYRVSDIMTRSGLKWDIDAHHILNEEEFHNTFLYEMLRKNSLNSTIAANFEEMRSAIRRRGHEILTERDLGYLQDERTIIVYIRMGDRIDRLPVHSLIEMIDRTGARRIVLSFVMHFGSWTPEDIRLFNEQRNVSGSEIMTGLNRLWSYNTEAARENYLYIWDMTQRVRKYAPGIQIEIRSNEIQDEDLALYVQSTHFAACRCGGFEKILHRLRNNSNGVLQPDIAPTFPMVWVQHGSPVNSADTMDKVMILMAFGWLFYSPNAVDVCIGSACLTTHHTRAQLRIHVDGDYIQKNSHNRIMAIFSNDEELDSSCIGDPMHMHIIHSPSTGRQDEQRPLGFDSSLVDFYASPQVFNFTNKMAPDILKDLKHWLALIKIVRVCCEPREINPAWRNVLHNLSNTQNTSIRATIHDIPNGTHICQNYDFDSVEISLSHLEGILFQQRVTKVGYCKCIIRHTILHTLRNSNSHRICGSNFASEFLYNHRSSARSVGGNLSADRRQQCLDHESKLMALKSKEPRESAEKEELIPAQNIITKEYKNVSQKGDDTGTGEGGTGGQVKEKEKDNERREKGEGKSVLLPTSRASKFLKHKNGSPAGVAP